MAIKATGMGTDVRGVREWADSRSVLDLTVYSDGSVKDGSAGAGGIRRRGHSSRPRPQGCPWQFYSCIRRRYNRLHG